MILSQVSCFFFIYSSCRLSGTKIEGVVCWIPNKTMIVTIAVLNPLAPFITKEKSQGFIPHSAYAPQKTTPAIKCQKYLESAPINAPNTISKRKGWGRKSEKKEGGSS